MYLLEELNSAQFDFDKMGRILSKLPFLASAGNYCEDPDTDLIDSDVIDDYVCDKEDERWDSKSAAYVKPLWIAELSHREQQDLAEELLIIAPEDGDEDAEVIEDDDLGLHSLFGEDEGLSDCDEDYDTKELHHIFDNQDDNDECLKLQVV